MMKDIIKIWCFIILFLALITSPLWIWVMKSYFEANAFNAATGGHVTTWQAMWVELRVQTGTADAYGKESK